MQKVENNGLKEVIFQCVLYLRVLETFLSGQIICEKAKLLSKIIDQCALV